MRQQDAALLLLTASAAMLRVILLVLQTLQARRWGQTRGWVTHFVSSMGALNACRLATCSRHGPVMCDGAGPEILEAGVGDALCQQASGSTKALPTDRV